MLALIPRRAEHCKCFNNERFETALRQITVRVVSVLLVFAASCASLCAEEDERWNAYGQATYIANKHDAFSAPYTNLNGSPNSLVPQKERSWSATATAYLGVRLRRRCARLQLGRGGRVLRRPMGFPRRAFPSASAAEPAATRPPALQALRRPGRDRARPHLGRPPGQVSGARLPQRRPDGTLGRCDERPCLRSVQERGELHR